MIRWSPEMDAALIAAVNAGKPYSEIARTLGTTRNACIGRGNRLGLGNPERARPGCGQPRSFSHRYAASLRAKGRTYAEIAEMLGVTTKSVWRAVQRVPA
jgi:hypothetical protein